MKHPARRDLLKAATLLPLGAPILHAPAAWGVTADPESLGAIAAGRGIRYGTAVAAAHLAADPAYAALVARECTILVPEVEAKWAATEPADGMFDFADLDHIVGFARAHGIAIRLHNLVWGVWNPPWLEPAIRSGRAGALLARHIATVAGRYRGRVVAWDVANEVSDPRWNRRDDLIGSPWEKALGIAYFDNAFRLARRADPVATLYVNDDDLEYDDAPAAAKRAAYLRLVEHALRRGVPIQGFGLETHLKPDRRFDPRPYRDFLRDLAAMGLELSITELDVNDRSLPPDPLVRQRACASLCAALLAAALDEPALRAVLTWGITARYSWLNTDPVMRRPDGARTAGLPYDESLRPTLMRAAIAAAFRAAPPR